MMTTPADANANPYDAVPYRSYPYAQTSPGRLAAIAAVMGVDAAAPGKARVLELGCCSGGNLLPMAEQYPGGRFVGIDASGRQIDDGQADVDACGLANLRLVQLDIRDIGPELGEFDYIIAHGVYSWVPQDVQRKLLHVCRENLAPNGVAYVSYNTHPGWRMRGIIRDVMRFRARSFQQPADRIRHARALVDLLASAVPSEENAYGMLLKRELEMLRDKDDHYLLHDHLEEDNEPIYFHEFAARAKAEGLQYLGEADFGTMSPRNLPGQIATVIEGLSADVIELEQYMDFVRNRMFRQTLLCRAELPVNRVPSPERVARLWVASEGRPEGPVGELRSSAQLVFRGPRATTTTTDPLVKAALVCLNEAWPRPVPFGELLASAQARLGRPVSVLDTTTPRGDGRRLAETLLRGFSTGQVELSADPPSAATKVAERPLATPYARLQASREGWATNRRHEMVRLDDLERHVLRLADGTRDRAALLDALAAAAASGAFAVHNNGKLVTDAEAVKPLLGQPVDTALARLASRVLFVDHYGT